ncbi:hypothetical protein SAZ_27955 [Streptomyces noursei ZPM]|nr:hypothetical protein SAZ_27955 [Streptomyces noursei ZPM]
MIPPSISALAGPVTPWSAIASFSLSVITAGWAVRLTPKSEPTTEIGL